MNGWKKWKVMKWLKDLKENKEEKINILKNKVVLKVIFLNIIFMYLY